jgi:hypothetical protein
MVMLPTSVLLALTLKVVGTEQIPPAITRNFTGTAVLIPGKLKENDCSLVTSKSSPNQRDPVGQC